MLYFFLISFILFVSIINALFIILNDDFSIYLKFISFLFIFIISYLSIFNFKELFLPFLGVSAYPPSLIPNELYPPNSNFKIELNLNYPNGTKIIYWASNPINNDKNKIYDNPYDAYANFKNSGVAIINNNKAIIHINCPNQYKVPPFNKTLDKHIHYRIATPNNPILSDVKTIYINC